MRDVTPEKALALLDGTTPGPFSCQCYDAAAYVYGPGGNLIAEVMGALSGSAPANARLFAAAPDLALAYIAQAAELTRLRAKIDHDRKTFDQMLADATTMWSRRVEAIEVSRDPLIARTADMERQLAEAREVKPLEWAPWRGDPHRHVAVTPYGVAYNADDKGWWIALGPNGEASSIKSAKAAAQADFTARILSALKGDTP